MSLPEKYESPQTVQTDNSRFNTMINANYPHKSLYSISNKNLRFTLFEQNLYLIKEKFINNIQKQS